MKARTLTSLSLIAALSVATTGCESLTPGENAGVVGTVVGSATGIAMGAAGVPGYITAPVAIGAGALAGAATYVIAKHQATERQRKIAEQRARLYYAELEAKREREEAAERAAEQRRAQSTNSSPKPKPTPKKKKKEDEAPRYIAVDTVKEENSTGKKAVMIYDTQTEKLVGNDVYDLEKSPKVGETTKLDTYTAQYVGTGS